MPLPTPSTDELHAFAIQRCLETIPVCVDQGDYVLARAYADALLFYLDQAAQSAASKCVRQYHPTSELLAEAMPTPLAW